ncbi:OmpL47-type beta-barrel domain-containing protein [Paenibacillus prosopidis]|uniref:Alginate lyase n=1 Tax=Paenibacillus prosopidis TaxID=630520 RepID=A0A368W8J4_9BACL|nr:discoidin domain-containing protein [Paenibacillus prosopidis]RCW51945.1 alginate lyase [Paenibacillus prosopidis]
MTFLKGLNFGKRFNKRFLSIVVSISLLATFLPFSPGVSAADQSFFTDYQPTVNEVIDASGFKHPGVGLTKDILENMRTQVRAQKEPWNTYFNQMITSSTAAKNVGSSNQGSEPTKPGSDAFNSQGFNQRFIQDGLKAYTQAILYYVTGDEVYRSNAMRIIRIWSHMDPAKYAYFNDAHIHTGIPLNRMVTAAEILRYTSTQTPELVWTDQDTTDFTNNLINPVIETFQHTNYRFMNQHLYPLIGAMSGYIFTGNTERYAEGVEWFTVNKTAVDQGQNGAIKQLFRLVDTNIVTGEPVNPPVVQHVEMGRDQAHGAGDVTNMEILSRLLMAQGTKVDPVEGTISTAPNAVGPYEFLDNRILKAADFFARYMIGYDTPWIPVAAHTDINGAPTIIYKHLAGGYRGRIGGNVYDLYYYYKYTAGINMETVAPYFTEMFNKRLPFHWESPDAGADYWLYIPQAAEAEGAQHLPKPITNPDLREIEDRYTKLDSNSATQQEGDTAFVRITATEGGSKIAYVGAGTGERTVAFKIRTNGVAKMEAFGDTITLPDTKGQWRYISYAFNNFQGFGDLVYFTVKGAGTVVDMDHVNVKAGVQLTPPVFTAGSADLNLFTYVGSEAAINYDFSATDAGATDVVSYQADLLPAGAVFNETTGAFSWTPTQAGTYSFVVSASDGTTITTRDVTIVVANDRQSAVNAVIAPYQADTLYISSTLEHYQNVHADVMNQIASATDDVFYQKLFELNSAVQGLQKLTPLINDGSVNYTNMFVSSTFGNGSPSLLDGTNDSFVCFCVAQDRTHHMDFGPSYKISANAFELQVRASFPERIGGVAIFGSNDKETWTRLTPGLTTVTEEMQRLEVQDDLENQRFRFLKIQMIQPSSTMLEIAEFRIFGQRFETVNKLESVSIGSEQSLKNRIIPGDTIKLSFKSTEQIQDVAATIQGQAATISTVDNLNWTATLVVDPSVQTGTVKFKLNYKTAAGVAAAETIFTTDGSTIFISDQTGYVSNLLEIANLSDSSGRNPADLLATASTLFDSNLGTFTDFRLNGSGYGGYLTFDFKEGGEARLSKVEVIGRQDGFSGRINGTVVQGSNDNVTWTTISNAAWNTAEWQTLTINGTNPYRYIRITNGNQWFGNMSELRLYGDVQIKSKLDSVSISSAQSIQKRIIKGNTVKVAFKSTEMINNVNVNIHGQAATVSTADNINWTAEAVMGNSVSSGPVNFSINYKTAAGIDGPEKTTTTDNSSLYIADETGLISNVLGITTLSDSSGRNPADLLATAGNLFDSNAGTITDFRVNGSGYGGYLTFDFKEGNLVTLSKAEVLARQDSNYTRISGVVVQGSSDNTNWTTISTAAGKSMDWQTLSISGTVPYRYIRIYNANQWFGNMSELRLYGAVEATNKIETASISSAQSLKTRIVPGNTVKLSFKAKEAINNVQVKIQGQDATVSSADNINWTAEATLNQGVAVGNVTFAVNYKTLSGVDGYPAKSTTDGSKLYIVDESDLISNVTSIANLIDSTSGRTAATTLSITNSLFDGNLGSITDYRLNGTGSGSYITFDFKQGNQATLSSVELIGRQESNLLGRIKNTVIQGSNDNTTWTDLTTAAVASGDWQSLPVSSKVPYRYIRVWNWSAWFGNMAELRLHGVVKAADVTSPVTTDNAPQGWVNQDTTVSFNAADESSGVAATYYKVDGGAQQTGNMVTLTTEGTHTLVYWSVDWAGNVEQQHTVVVNIDKTIEGATFAADITGPTNQDVTVTISYPVDAVVKEYKVGDSGAWTAYTAPVVVSTNGTVYARSTDAAGNVAIVTSYTLSNIDKTAPADPALSADTIVPTNQDVTVTISYPEDAAVKEYKVGDSGAWTAYTAPVVVSANDTVYARSTDDAGNVSNVSSYAVSNIDKIAPVTAATLNPAAPNGSNGWYTSDVTVSLSVYDLSGVAITEYQVNNGSWIAYTDSIPAFGDGVYTVNFRSTDLVGNVEQIKTVEFKVDKTAPELYVQLDQTTIWPGNHKMVTVNAVLNSNDNGSGVESVVLTSITSDQPDSGLGDIEADFGTADTSFSLRAEKARIYTITYTVTDKAGNKTVVSVNVTVPHDLA